MNHLAHLFLAKPTVPSRVGNLMGDFAQGLDIDALPAPVRAGLLNHRAIDTFTDEHPEVRACKPLFSHQRRRFAGVALDVLFDHYLLRHWSRFSTADADAFIHESYRDLHLGRHLMPERMARVTGRMMEDNWLGSYRSLDTIGFALDRVASRIRFPNRFAGIIDEIREHDDELEARFLAFFPALLENNRNRRQWVTRFPDID